jgi:hypothetical protein
MKILRLLFVCYGILANEAQVPEFSKVSAFPITSTVFSGGAYGNGKFVVVGNNRIAYSIDDGLTWIDAKGYPRTNFNGVIFGVGMFVAIADGKQTVSSLDGVNWVPHDLPKSLNLKAIAYGNALFEAIGDATVVSSDGVSWSILSPQAGSPVAFANGVFVTYASLGSLGYWLDPNCTNAQNCWFLGTNLGISGGYKVSLVAEPNGFVCNVNYYHVAPPGYTGYVSQQYLVTSPDGISWTVGSGGGSRYFKLFQVQNGFVQFEFSIFGGALSFSSPAGGAESGTAHFPPFYNYNAFAWNGSTLLGLCSGDIWRYVSGNWVASTKSPQIRITSGAASGSVFVGVGATNSAGGLVPQIVVATNGLPSLIPITPPDGSGALTSVRYADGRFVAVGKGGTVIRSSDGTNWTRRLSNTTSDLYDLVHGNGLWVAVGDAGKIVTSSDSSVFSLRSSGTETPIFGVTYGTNQFVGVGKDGLILTSANGIDWSATGTDEARDLYSIAYGNGRFVAVGTNGIVHTSTNAVDWPSITIPNVSAFRRVAFGNGYFVALTSTNNVLFGSKDGVNWTSTQISDVNVLGLDFSDNELWLTGEQSTIWKTSLSPALAPSILGGVDSSKRFVLSVQPLAAGDYEIESASSLPATNWSSIATLTNINVLTTWTDTNSPQPTKFYRVLRQ